MIHNEDNVQTEQEQLLEEISTAVEAEQKPQVVQEIVGSGEVQVDEIASEPQLPQNLPKKFIDKDTGEIRLEALVNSYNALEKRLSQITAPPKTDEERCRLYRLLGQPESALEYDVTLPEGIIEVDPDVNERLHKLGCTQEQVQEVYNLAGEKMLKAMHNMANEYKADREVEKLVAHFGGGDKWHEVSRQLLSFGQNTLPNHVLDNLACSFEGVLALHKMMKSGISSAPSAREEDDGYSYNSDKKALDSMLKDQRYWKEKDPEFVARVTRGFEKLYKNS